MTEISIFKNFSNWIENKSLITILNDIKNGLFKTQIIQIRTLLQKGGINEADSLKKQLLGFTTSGTFNNGRTAKAIEKYSGFVILDIDKLTNSELENTMNYARLAPFTFASFISPSGKGLKIIVQVDSDVKSHKTAYQQVQEYYEQALNIVIDTSGSDISRLCFVSYDPQCYINEKAEIFKVEINDTKEKEKYENANSINANLNTYEIFQNCIEFTNKVTSYYEGNRNNYIHQLACNCNRVGLTELDTLNFSFQNFDLSVNEIKAAVNSAYKNNTQDFAMFANFVTSNNTVVNYVEEGESKLFNMPYLPHHIFDKLPNILKKGCEVFKDKRERDVFFTGAISILSGCMNTVSGSYRGKRNFANLFSFVIAPAASGKGSLTYAKDLGSKYHERLVNLSNELLKQFKIEESEYKKKLTNKAIDTANLEPPIEPPFKVLFIPANSSSSRVIQHLKEGDEMGIFCETEADSMGNVLKQDWGGYSDLLRKAFQHEPISISRKTDKEFTEIKSPRLSVSLAGTPGQVQNLIKSAEDGLFSRFIFYTFKTELEWIVADADMNGVNLTNHFENLSNEVLIFIDYLIRLGEIDFQLQPNQWVLLNKFGKENLNRVGNLISEDLASTSKRLALMLFRMCMILTALRYFDNGEHSKTFTCTDEDFEIALELIKVYNEHSIHMFNELPKSGDVTEKVIQQLYDSLPFKFQRKTAVDIANNKYQIKPRTTDLYLTKLVAANYLEKIKSGFYQKNK